MIEVLPSELVDVEWAPDGQGVFEAGIRLLVADRRGLLADLAMAIADADANIDTVSMERPDGDEVLAMFFGVQVRDQPRHRARPRRGRERPVRRPHEGFHAARVLHQVDDQRLALRLELDSGPSESSHDHALQF